MLLVAIKHYLIVGLVFAFAAAWVLVRLVNTAIGIALESTGALQGDPYWFALFTTLTAIALISSMTLAGNVIYRRR